MMLILHMSSPVNRKIKEGNKFLSLHWTFSLYQEIQTNRLFCFACPTPVHTCIKNNKFDWNVCPLGEWQLSGPVKKNKTRWCWGWTPSGVLLCCVFGFVRKTVPVCSYTKEEPLNIRYTTPSDLSNFFLASALDLSNVSVKKVRRRCRGKPGGALVCLHRRWSSTSLPGIFLSNIRSLSNKMDEKKLGLFFILCFVLHGDVA